jgi:hypothetical protein
MRLAMGSPVLTRHSQIVRLTPAEAMTAESGEYATANSRSSLSLRVRICENAGGLVAPVLVAVVPPVPEVPLADAVPVVGVASIPDAVPAGGAPVDASGRTPRSSRSQAVPPPAATAARHRR